MIEGAGWAVGTPASMLRNGAGAGRTGSLIGGATPGQSMTRGGSTVLGGAGSTMAGGAGPGGWGEAQSSSRWDLIETQLSLDFDSTALTSAKVSGWRGCVWVCVGGCGCVWV